MTGIVSWFPLRARHRWWIVSISGVMLSLLILALVITNIRSVSFSHPTSAQVTVNVQQSLGHLTSISKGLNVAAFDPHLLTPSTQLAVKDAGVNLLRFPGGLDSDLYHWQSNTMIKSDHDTGNNTFDAFMNLTQSVNAQAMITVNYGSGTPTEAAHWVQYANKGGSGYQGPVPTYRGASSTGHNYGVKYWEIGNEVYGDGTYIVKWEQNDHGNGPSIYARNVLAYSKAMKAVDSTIKIGVVLTAPGIWPDGVTNASSRLPWNRTVLPIVCSTIDFVVIHWYAQSPGNESDAALLASPTRIADMVSTVRNQIQQYCGTHASAVQIMLTETNSVSYNPGKQLVSRVNALFLADNYMTWLEHGIANVDWWNLHDWAINMYNLSPSLDGDILYGNYGILSGAMCSNLGCEPPLNTPYPPYYALQMLKYLGGPGDTMVAASSSHNLIAVHAMRQANGKLALLLINKDPDTTSTVSFSFKGYNPDMQAQIYTYKGHGEAITSLSGTTTRVSMAPYSLTTIVFTPART